jgi:hypothetical protein
MRYRPARNTASGDSGAVHLDVNGTVSLGVDVHSAGAVDPYVTCSPPAKAGSR